MDEEEQGKRNTLLQNRKRKRNYSYYIKKNNIFIFFQCTGTNKKQIAFPKKLISRKQVLKV